MVTFKNTHGPLNESGLNAKERRFLNSLPSDYAEFLRRHNGGTPVPDVITAPNVSTAIAELFSFTKCFDMSTRNDAFGLPDFVITIGRDIGGNLFCLGVSRNEKGKVYWKSHEADLDEPMEDLHLVRTTFTEFLTAITADDEPPKEVDPIENLGQNGTADDLLKYLEQGSMEDRSSIGLSIIEEAARYRNPELVKKCLELGFAPGKALHLAVQGNQRELVEFLLDEVGCDINEVDDRGTTPWQRSYGHSEMRAFLESRGAIPGKEY